MKIEPGYYRLRCGGAVRIDEIVNQSARSSDSEWDKRTGMWCEEETSWDIIAKITKEEHDRIVSGELSKISEQVYDNEDLHDAQFEAEQLNNTVQSLSVQLADSTLKVEALKAENEELKNKVLELKEDAKCYKTDFEESQTEINALRAQFLQAARKPNEEIIDLKKRLEAAERNAAIWEYRATDRGYGDEIEALKKERDDFSESFWKLQKEFTAMERAYKAVTQMQDQRRFEAAKAAMQGILASDEYSAVTANLVAGWAVEQADALLKALEEQK